VSKQGLGVIPLGLNVETQRTCGINAEIKNVVIVHHGVNSVWSPKDLELVKFIHMGNDAPYILRLSFLTFLRPNFFLARSDFSRPH